MQGHFVALAAQIQADGIAATVTNHADADAIVNQIVTRYQAGDRGPIVLIGHSLGADAVIAMAQALDQYNREADAFHASLSWTRERISKVNKAGATAMKNIGRQPQRGKTVQNAMAASK